MAAPKLKPQPASPDDGPTSGPNDGQNPDSYSGRQDGSAGRSALPLDAHLALALMTKARAVFEEPDTVTSFPTVPITYPAKMLESVAKGLADAKSQWFIPEFSRLVDALPHGPLWQTGGTASLSQVYGEVLREAELAGSTRSATEDRRLETVRAQLFVIDGQGDLSEHPAMVKYKAYRDRHFVLEQEFRNAESASKLSHDPATLNRWRETRQPALLAKLERHLQDWITEGQKIQLEAALNEYKRLTAKEPGNAWETWRSNFKASIDVADRPYFPTGFEPHDFMEHAWSSFTLSAMEANDLVRKADPALRDRLNPEGAALTFASVTFEYRSVRLNRPWFAKEVFESRHWKLEGAEPLSDGKTHASGRCPAYVTALVFARNIELTLNDPAAGTAAAGPSRLKPSSFALPLAGKAESLVTAPAQGITDPAPQTAPQTAPAAQAAQALHLLEEVFNKLRSGGFNALASTPTAPTAPTTPASVASDTLDTGENGQVSPQPGAAQNASVGSQEPNRIGENDELFILALISKRLPKCPNPDLRLRWN
jgi:hypothetical protein